MKATYFSFCMIALCTVTSVKSQNIFPASGNVGIGTSSPVSTLDVIGNITMSGNGTVRTIWNNGYGGALQLLRSDIDHNRYSRLGVVNNTGNWLGGVTITDDGNASFDGNIILSANATLRTIWNGGYGGALQLLRSDADHNRYSRLGVVSNTGFWLGGITVKDDLTTLFDGKVGIGTSLPTEKLTVDGNVYATGNISAYGFIKTKKVVVSQTAWPDYVFDKEYKLRSFSSLEAFIKQNKHLPELPSAKEVQEQGISVGDNQALLLKKIEELTLYLIQLNKKIDELKAENQQIKSKLAK